MLQTQIASRVICAIEPQPIGCAYVGPEIASTGGERRPIPPIIYSAGQPNERTLQQRTARSACDMRPLPKLQLGAHRIVDHGLCFNYFVGRTHAPFRLFV